MDFLENHIFKDTVGRLLPFDYSVNGNFTNVDEAYIPDLNFTSPIPMLGEVEMSSYYVLSSWLIARFVRECNIPLDYTYGGIRQIAIGLSEELDSSEHEGELSEACTEAWSDLDFLQRYFVVSRFFSFNGEQEESEFVMCPDALADVLEENGENDDEEILLTPENVAKLVDVCFNGTIPEQALQVRSILNHFTSLISENDRSSWGGETVFFENLLYSPAAAKYLKWAEANKELVKSKFSREDRLLRKCLSEISVPVYFKHGDLDAWSYLDEQMFIVGYVSGWNESGTLDYSNNRLNLFFAVVGADSMLALADEKFNLKL